METHIKEQIELDQPLPVNSLTDSGDNTRNTVKPPPEPEEDDDKPKSSSPRPWPKPKSYFGAKRVFALLIAIDHYDMPGANLGGCVQDSLAVEKYLRDETDGVGERLHLMCLRSALPSQQDKLTVEAPAPASRNLGQPTRQGIIDAFTGFLTQAQSDDIVLVHYSGHGSFETRPQELWHLDAEESSDHRAETLVCQDSYTTVNGTYIPALRDKELRWLIAQVAVNNPHIVLLMDCCNSSGNTRFKEEGTLARFTPSATVDEKNGIASYVFHQKDAQARALLDTNPTQFHLPEGRHVALYACHSYQLAKETSFPEGRFGVFTYYVLQTLRACKGHITYRDLLKLVRNKASERVDQQAPQYHCALPADADLVFLGGSAAKAGESFTILPTNNPQEGRLDAGSLHGLLSPDQGATYFTVFSANDSVRNLEAAHTRQAVLKELAPDHAILAFTDGAAFPNDEVLLKAVVKASPLAKTKVCIELEDEETLLDENTPSQHREVLEAAKAQLQQLVEASGTLQLVDKTEGGWQYRLFVYVFQGLQKLRITEKDKVEALIAPKMGWAAATMQAFVDEMTHIAKWERTLNLKNEHPSLIPPGLITVEALDESGKVVTQGGQEIVLKAAADGQTNPQLKFRVSLQDHYPAPLYCALLHVRPDFGINPSLLASDAHLGTVEFVDGNIRIKREQMEVYAGSHVPVNGATNPEGLYLQFSLPKTTGGLQVDEVKDHFKLIVSTEQFDPLHLWQNGLQRAHDPRAGRPPEVESALDSLMHEVQHRDASWAIASAEPPKKITDWYATHLTVTTRK